MVLVGDGSQQKYYKRTRTEPSTGVDATLDFLE